MSRENKNVFICCAFVSSVIRFCLGVSKVMVKQE